MNKSIPSFVKGPYPDIGIKQLIEDFKEYLEELEGLTIDIQTKLKGNYLVSLPGLSIGTTPENVANVAFDFQIGGVRYTRTAVAAGTALAGDNIPQSTFGAWRLEIGANGTIDIVPATGNAVGYASAALAIAGLPAVSADHVSMGVVTATNSAAVFDPGTTSLAAGTVTAAYTDGQTAFQAIIV